MKRKNQLNSSQSEQQQQEQEFSQQPRLPLKANQKNQRARRSNVVPRNYQHDFSDQQMKQQSSEGEYIYFKGGRISKILAQRTRQGTQQIQKLCKFFSKSYLHVQWLTDAEINSRNIQVTRQTKRTISSNQSHLLEIQQKFGQQHYFNPAFVRVDRILTTAVLFPVMHHKKGSQMNGKWSQMMMLVCSKILNFEKNHIPYGVIQKDDYHPQYIEQVKLQNKIKIQHVINRVYLDKYQAPEQFWKDVGQSIRTLLKGYQNTGRQHDAELLKQCVIFLYWNWFSLSKQRFLHFLPKQAIYQKIRSDLQSNRCLIGFQFKSGNTNSQFDFDDLLKENIFIKNYSEKPTSQKQLLLLHPGRFSYAWLANSGDSVDYTNTLFQHLNVNDIKKLDLNVQIDSLYLIKWCDLDYDQVSWQKQSDLPCIEKISNFKMYSKIPPKKDRERIQENKKYHKTILSALLDKNKQSSEVIQKCRRRLYHYSQSTKQVKQYNDSDRPVYKDYKVLKNFQLQGLNWLIKCWHEKRNCILADEMGLGKTIQTIAFLNHLQVYQGVLGPFLVVAPVSTLKQWRSQIQNWSDLNCVLYKGKAQVRDLIEQYQFYHKFVTNEGIFVKFQKLPRFQVLLTNYEIFVSDIEMFQKLAFQHVIMDQAHKMKNAKTKIAQTLKLLPCPRILLLTGTPIQNNTSQIFGLLNIIEPRKFNSLQTFKQKFGKLKTVQELTQLKQTLKPYLMRRVKSDVQKSIPKLSEMLVNLQLTKVQKAFYKGILQKNKNRMISSLNSTAINNLSQCLRQCCNHPYMLSHQVQDQITSTCETDEQRFQKFISSSSKLIFVHKFISKCKQTKAKTLIFTQYLQMIQLLKQYCSRQKILFEILDGSVNYQDRQNRIDRFNLNPDVLVFVISTKAGGIGINLTSATNIIIYDSDWNPQNDIQAIARAHRIGQNKNVSVYRLITTQTYEDVLYKTAVKKLGIGLAILDNQYFNNHVDNSTNNNDTKKQKSKEQIEKLLRDGVLAFLKAEQNKTDEKDNLQNQSIQDIIKRSSTTIDYQTKDCSFTKTKFQYEQQKNKIGINDPNFWQVALQNVQSPLQKLVKKLKNQQETKKIFQSYQEQLKLMIQANEVVFNFVKSKTSMSHFNAQDERQLRIFLQKITYSRQFHRQYKSIANDWLQQIQKPSRRFQKYEIAKLTQIIGQSKFQQPPPQRIIRSRSKKTQNQSEQQLKQQKKTIQKTIKAKKSRTIQSSDNEAQQNIPESPKQIQGSEQQKIQLPVKNKSKKSKKNVVRNNNSDQGQDNGDQQCQKKSRGYKISLKDPSLFKKQISQNLQFFLQRPCQYCERKMCSKICKGRCKRSFHQICYQKFCKKSQQLPTLSQIKQLKQSRQQICDGLSAIFKCEQCVSNIAPCFICGIKGKAIASYWSQKKTPKRPLRFSQNPQSRNQIDGLYAQATNQEKKAVFQCRMDYCTKTYHLQCLKDLKNPQKSKLPLQLTFQVYGNKQQGSYPLKCPYHFCAICKKKLCIFKSSCLRCPVSYHVKCKQLKDEDIYEIDGQSFLCLNHMDDNELQYRDEERQLSKPFKKQKIDQKKQEKQSIHMKDTSKDEQNAGNPQATSQQITQKIGQAFKQVEKQANREIPNKQSMI